MYRPQREDVHEKQRMRRWLYSKTTFAVLIVCIFVAGMNAWDMYQKARLTKTQLAQTEEAYAKLQEREAFLSEETKQLETEAGVEAKLRERFGVAKEGEEVIVILDDTESEESAETLSWWQRVVRWMRGNDDYDARD